MSEQYNAIATSFSHIYSPGGKLPCYLIQEPNFQAAIVPFVRGARVLDLACGSGLWSRKLLEWGAASVVGVDISPGMIMEAKRLSKSQAIPRERLEFLVGDATDNNSFASDINGEFDLVIAVWLLNYASSATEMQAMFKTISSSLKFG